MPDLSRRSVLTALALTPFAALLPARAAAGQDPVTPGGPCVQDGQPIRLSGLTDNEQLARELQQLAARRPESVDLEVIGRSVEGRPLHLVTVGTGPRSLVLLTQQHGDEPLGTEAALALVKELSGPSPAAQRLRDQVTVLVVPRVNPDGFERYLDYENLPDGVDPRRNANAVDLNRDYGVGDTTVQPESAAVLALLARIPTPDLVVDYHHQVSYRTADDEQVTMSVLWGTHPGVAPAVADDGKRAAVVAAQSVERFGRSTLTLYPTSNTPTVARNGLSLRGIPTLLVEQRGQQDVGQKSHGALTQEALRTMRAFVESLADGSFDAADPAAALALPARGQRWRCEDDE